VSATLDLATLRAAIDYHYEVLTFGTLVATLGPQASQPVFPSLQGWNPASDPGRVLLEWVSAGATPIPGVQLTVTNDQHQRQEDLGGYPPDLAPRAWQAAARTRLAATVLNTNAQAVTNVGIRYTVRVWRLPVAQKVLRGWPLTPQDRQAAQAAHLHTDPQQSRGTLPFQAEVVERATWDNRVVDADGALAVQFPVSTTPQTVHHVQARPDTVLLLRRVAFDSYPDDGVTLSVTRDADEGHVIIPGWATALHRPVPLFIPARDHFTFTAVAQTAPRHPVLFRLTVQTVALSLLLRVRLGLVDLAGLQALLGPQAGAQVWDQALAGTRM